MVGWSTYVRCEQGKRMPTTTPQERARTATQARMKHSRDRRLRRYAAEMAQGTMPDDVVAIMAQELHQRGWLVLAPDRLAPGGLRFGDQAALAILLTDAGWCVTRR